MSYQTNYQNLLIEENGQARQIFSESSPQPIGRRYSHVRNVVTSRSMMDALAQMSAWSVERWIRHDEPAFVDPESGRRSGLGQAVCFLV
jgi:hypothetical protein